jgi:hypothetical protein
VQRAHPVSCWQRARTSAAASGATHVSATSGHGTRGAIWQLPVNWAPHACAPAWHQLACRVWHTASCLPRRVLAAAGSRPTPPVKTPALQRLEAACPPPSSAAAGTTTPSSVSKGGGEVGHDQGHVDAELLGQPFGTAAPRTGVEGRQGGGDPASAGTVLQAEVQWQRALMPSEHEAASSGVSPRQGSGSGAPMRWCSFGGTEVCLTRLRLPVDANGGHGSMTSTAVRASRSCRTVHTSCSSEDADAASSSSGGKSEFPIAGAHTARGIQHAAEEPDFDCPSPSIALLPSDHASDCESAASGVEATGLDTGKNMQYPFGQAFNGHQQAHHLAETGATSGTPRNNFSMMGDDACVVPACKAALHAETKQ